jgi:DNA-binding NarL/FixJ family response regulator
MICETIQEFPLEKARRVGVARIVPTILLADDHEEVRRTVASVLQGEFQIVAIAENGVQVIELALSSHPDVTAVRAKAIGCRSKVLFLTVDEDPDFAEAAMSVGALGYVLKPRLATDLIPAIRSVLEGRVYISRSMHSFPRSTKS